MPRPVTGSPEQMRRIDREAIEDYGLPGVVLMENAGRGAAAIALEMLPSPGNASVVVLCGKGNNGGDGFVVARHLHNAGVQVATWLTGCVADIPAGSDAGINLHVARRMGIDVVEVLTEADAHGARESLGRCDLVVDALLGTGLSGTVRPPVDTLVECLNACGRPVLSVDAPSGLCGDTGRILGVAVKATRTATFVAAKRGFFLGDGPGLIGRLHLVDIGVPRAVLRHLL